MNIVFLQVAHHAMLGCSEALDIILKSAASCGDPRWMILQSFRKLSITRWDAQEPHFPISFEEIFNGRIFGERGEVRWVKEGPCLQVWELREAQSGSIAYIPQIRKYYLWGSYKTEQQRFVEDRIPGVPHYPLLDIPAENDRAFILVREYETLVTKETEMEELERQLNQPRLAAHRFIRLACGNNLKDLGGVS